MRLEDLDAVEGVDVDETALVGDDGLVLGSGLMVVMVWW
jgi:hypothetical protein